MAYINTKFENMTAAIEKVFVTLAKNKVKGAANALFSIYRGEIETQHKFTPIGTTPTKLGYNWNPNNISYKSHSGKIFFDFCDALENFDYAEASTTAKLPFLAYFRSIMGYRGQDALNEEQEYNKKICTLSGLKQKANPSDDRLPEEIMEDRMQRDCVYNSDKEERKQKAMEKLVGDITAKTHKAIGSASAKKAKNARTAHQFLTTYSDVSHEPDGTKNTMSKVALRIKGKADARSGMYYHKNKVRVHLNEDDEERFHEALRLVNE